MRQKIKQKKSFLSPEINLLFFGMFFISQNQHFFRKYATIQCAALIYCAHSSKTEKKNSGLRSQTRFNEVYRHSESHITFNRMFFAILSANFQLIFMKFCKNYFRVPHQILYCEIFIEKYCTVQKIDRTRTPWAEQNSRPFQGLSSPKSIFFPGPTQSK